MPPTSPSVKKSAPKSAPKSVPASAPKSVPVGAPKSVVSKTAREVAKKPNKTEFVRALPATMPAKQVVEKAKASGLKISVAYVYGIRSATRRPAGKRAAAKVSVVARRRGASASPASVVSRAVTRRVSADDLLRAVASEIGLSRAIAILEEQHRTVLSVLRG